MQRLFFAGLVIPAGLGLIYPGYLQYDALLGVPPLPLRALTLVSGGILLLAGLYLMAVSLGALRRWATALTPSGYYRLVVARHLPRTRNPMSLGYDLYCISAGSWPVPRASSSLR